MNSHYKAKALYLNLTPGEKHPWIRFPKENGNIKHLIIGSFPPNKFTINKEELSPGDVCFFYGSDQNVFCELFCEAKGLGFFWRCDPARLKKWLIENHWGVTVIVLKTKKASDSAADSDLRVVKHNKTSIEGITTNKPIEVVFLTSKWISERFDTHVLMKSQPDFKMIQLISPSRNGLRRTEWASSFLRNKGEGSLTYRARYYKHILCSYSRNPILFK